MAFNFGGGGGAPAAGGGFNFGGGAKPAPAAPAAGGGGFGGGGGAGGGFSFGGGAAQAKPQAAPAAGGFNFGGGGGATTGTSTALGQGFTNNLNNSSTSGIANGVDFTAVYTQTQHPDGRAALEALAKMEWAYSVEQDTPVNADMRVFRFVNNYPFQYMFYDDIVQWYYEGGHKPFVKRSSKKGSMANGGNNVGAFAGTGGGFGFGGMSSPAPGGGNNQQGAMGTTATGASDFQVLLNQAMTGRISHEQFVRIAIQSHMQSNDVQNPWRHIKPSLWEQALQTTTIDGVKVFPVPCIGFTALKRRIELQGTRARLLEKNVARLRKVTEENRSRLRQTMIKIAERRRAQLDLRSKLIHVMTKVVKLHHWGKPTSEADMRFRERMNGLMAELHLPHRYQGQLDELQSQLDYRPDLQPGNNTLNRQHVALTKMDLERVYEFLRRQQEGLAKLNEIVRKDLRDLDIMRSRSLVSTSMALE